MSEVACTYRGAIDLVKVFLNPTGLASSMKRVGILIALIVVAFVIYKIAYPSVTLRYRITLQASVGGEAKTGSGVIEVTYARNVRLLGASADIVTEVRGEGVSVALSPSDRLLVLLARGEHPRSSPEDVVPVLFGVTIGGVGPEDFSRIAALTGRRDLPLELLPPLVRFRDAADPKSAEFIKPNDPVASSGGAIRIDRAFIEIVDAGYWPLNLMRLSGVSTTHKLGNELPWLGEKSSRDLFWRALYNTGFRPNGTVEPMMLLIRGS